MAKQAVINMLLAANEAARDWERRRVEQHDLRVMVGWHPLVKAWIVELADKDDVCIDRCTGTREVIVDVAFRWCEDYGARLFVMNGSKGNLYSLWLHQTEKLK